jgi:lysozyme family protein
MTTYLPTDHPAAFQILVLDEGGALDLSPNDPGNYSGGAVGVGTLGGSRFGISSATYPSVDKATLTAAAAEAIYFRDFWTKLRCADLPAPLRFMVYSCGVNSGQHAAGTWLQRALAVLGAVNFGGIDGAIGDRTVAAANKCLILPLVLEMATQRIVAISQTEIFAQDRLGLTRRYVADIGYAMASLAPVVPLPAAPPLSSA